ncbi:MAG TPA: hypothetical protein V6D22_05815 [Candidatus Obscuribacterales bacterium]
MSEGNNKPTVDERVKSDAQDLQKTAHDSGMHEAVSHLQQHVQDLTKNGGTASDVKAYWDKMQATPGMTDLLNKMSVQFVGDEKFNGINHDAKGQYGPYTNKGAETAAEQRYDGMLAAQGKDQDRVSEQGFRYVMDRQLQSALQDKNISRYGSLGQSEVDSRVKQFESDRQTGIKKQGEQAKLTGDDKTIADQNAKEQKQVKEGPYMQALTDKTVDGKGTVYDYVDKKYGEGKGNVTKDALQKSLADANIKPGDRDRITQLVNNWDAPQNEGSINDKQAALAAGILRGSHHQNHAETDAKEAEIMQMQGQMGGMPMGSFGMNKLGDYTDRGAGISKQTMDAINGSADKPADKPAEKPAEVQPQPGKQPLKPEDADAAFQAYRGMTPEQQAKVVKDGSMTQEKVKAAGEDQSLTVEQREAMKKLGDNWPGDPKQPLKLQDLVKQGGADVTTDDGKKKYGEHNEQVDKQQHDIAQKVFDQMKDITPEQKAAITDGDKGISKEKLDKAIADMKGHEEEPGYAGMVGLQSTWNKVARGDGSHATEQDLKDYASRNKLEAKADGATPEQQKEQQRQAELGKQLADERDKQEKALTGQVTLGKAPIIEQAKHLMEERSKALGIDLSHKSPAERDHMAREYLHQMGVANKWPVSEQQWKDYVDGNPQKHLRAGDPRSLPKELNGAIHTHEQAAALSDAERQALNAKITAPSELTGDGVNKALAAMPQDQKLAAMGAIQRAYMDAHGQWSGTVNDIGPTAVQLQKEGKLPPEAKPVLEAAVKADQADKQQALDAEDKRRAEATKPQNYEPGGAEAQRTAETQAAEAAKQEGIKAEAQLFKQAFQGTKPEDGNNLLAKLFPGSGDDASSYVMSAGSIKAALDDKTMNLNPQQRKYLTDLEEKLQKANVNIGYDDFGKYFN